jgi:hypothetical protein
MISFINNIWIVSLVCFLLGFAVTPALQRLVAYIQSRNGMFTGKYFAFTGDRGASLIEVETVKFRQVGDKVSGKIARWGSLSLDAHGEIAAEQTLEPLVYYFSGRTLGRQVQVNYWKPERESQNGGVIVLEPDADGSVFEGIWGGTGVDLKEGKNLLTGADCVWVRDRGNDLQGNRSNDLQGMGKGSDLSS